MASINRAYSGLSFTSRNGYASVSSRMGPVSSVYEGGLEYTRGRVPPEVAKQRETENLQSMAPYVKLTSLYLNATPYYKQTTTGKIFGINTATGEFDNPTEEMIVELEKWNAPGGMEAAVQEIHDLLR